MSDFDEEVVRKLANLLDETGLTDIEIETDGLRVKVGRNVTTNITSAAPTATHVQAASPVAEIAPSLEDHPGAVKSPMVGTAYHASDPDSEPFISVGDQVSVGQTLFIIEAMKVMNPIKATAGGTVKEILVQNGQPVEFNEVLVIVE